MANQTDMPQPGAPGQDQAGTGKTPAPTAREGATQKTGAGTAPPGTDVADPHASDEEHPYDARHPGGASAPTRDIGPNPHAHDGSAPPRPHNRGSGPD